MSNPELDAIAQRFGLGPDARHAIAELLARPRTGTLDDTATMFPGAFEDAARSDVWTPAEPESPALGERYEDLGTLGIGSMGEVRQVRDLTLNRVVAMKILRPEHVTSPTVLARFIEEAQTAAQLEHAGLVPVYDLGRLPDGRRYFTMMQIKGHTLSQAIWDLHCGTGAEWTLARLVEVFRRACEAVAHAHSRGVVHRDLKPENIMVGLHGEVLVVDWGIAKVSGKADHAAEDGRLAPVRTDRSTNDTLHTRHGTIAGTPAYMAPEQAAGQIDRIAAPTDVFALGAILFEVLTGKLAHGLGPAELGRALCEAPDELAEVCLHAMQPAPERRYADAAVMAGEVAVFQQGARKRQRALRLVEEANRLLPEVDALRARARAHEEVARRLLESIKPWDPIEAKKTAWAHEDDAAALMAQAEAQEIEAIQRLQGALTHAADLDAAHAGLADLFRARHAEAEARHDVLDAARFEALLRAHDRGRHAGYLSGDGAMSLVTDPPGAEVELFRYAEKDRQLVPERLHSLGRTPLHRVRLPMGSYLCLLKAPGRATVRYPVDIGREEHWDGVRPGAPVPHAVHLPSDDELGPDDVYVPAGWFISGGDPESSTSLPHRRVWLDGFVVRRFPVTNREYLAFLNDLLQQGRQDEAIRHLPRERAKAEGQLETGIYGLEDGRFVLKPDYDGDVWDPDWPVLLVSWSSACAFAAWEASRTGQPWRLPGEFEWEKAARGVDGRYLPWGDHMEPTLLAVANSRPGRPMPVPVQAFPADVSPYGVRGAAGNVCDWLHDPFQAEGPSTLNGVGALQAAAHDAQHGAKGGAWSGNVKLARCAVRRSLAPGYRLETIGFRLARPLAGA